MATWKVKVGVLFFLLFLKVAFLWNIGYSPVVLAVVIILPLITVFWLGPEMIGSTIAAFRLRQKQQIQSPPSFKEILSASYRNDKEPQRKDLKRFFATLASMSVMVNIAEFVVIGEVPTMSKVLSNTILIFIVFGLIDLFIPFSVYWIRYNNKTMRGY